MAGGERAGRQVQRRQRGEDGGDDGTCPCCVQLQPQPHPSFPCPHPVRHTSPHQSAQHSRLALRTSCHATNTSLTQPTPARIPPTTLLTSHSLAHLHHLKAVAIVQHHSILASRTALSLLCCRGARLCNNRRRLLLVPALRNLDSALEEAIYGWQEGVESNAVEVHIHNLRAKLGAGVVQTVRGIGYRVGGEQP